MIAVREMTRDDAESVVRYFLDATPQFLNAMGVDPAKMPSYDDWMKILVDNLDRPMESKDFFYVIWLLDDKPVGHSNINKIVFGKEAYMHLHMWKPDKRQQGFGTSLLRLSLPHYFRNFKLQELFCEPYALNAAPNKTLESMGFELVREYETTPGWINFHQPVKRWRMSRHLFLLSGGA